MARAVGRWARRAFWPDRVFGLALLAGALALYAADPYAVQFLRAKVFDIYQQVKPRPIPSPSPVTIVDIDERSLGEIGQWPWPRTTVATMTEQLVRMGAGVVAFDILFSEPDRMNPASVVETLPGLDPETKAKLIAQPSNDARFAAILKRTKAVVGLAGEEQATAGADRPPIKKSIAFKGSPPTRLPGFTYVVRPIGDIEASSAGHGVITVPPEPDGVVRRVATLFRQGNELYPALSIEMLRLFFNRPTILVESNAAGVRSIGIAPRSAWPPDGLSITTDDLGRVFPYFSLPDKGKYVSASDVVKGAVDPAKIRGKFVLIGTSAAGLKDIRAVPTEPYLPGVEVHAQLLEATLSRPQSYLVRPNYAIGAELALILFGGLLMVVLVPWIGAKWTMLAFVTVAGGAAGTSWYMFAQHLMLFDATYAVATVLLLYTALTYSGFAREEAQRRQVRSAFGHYLSPAMVQQLAENPDRLKLGGETRDMTMLFCDVRGFTAISEMYDAQGLTKLINKLLTPLTAIILEREGTVDKYMGDCIMAFWNAPLDDPQHARNACLSALRMTAAMGPLNEQLKAEAEAEGKPHLPLKVGVGLNSGSVVVGNMGSDMRFDYSVLGDNVNLASRLEGQCKTYAVDIVVGENTLARTDGLAALELDLIRVKGKKEAVRIFTLVGDETVASGNAYQALRGIHGDMLTAYRRQDWDGAAAKIAHCRELLDGFALGGLYDVYEERIAEYRANPPPADWDGVYEATSK